MATWTLANLIAEIARYTVTTSEVEHDSASEKYDLVGRCLVEFVRGTDCLFATGMTASTSSATIDLEATNFSRSGTNVKLYDVFAVRVTNSGDERQLEYISTWKMRQYYRGYQWAEAGYTSHWSMDSLTVMRLRPGPDATVNLAVDGFYYHPAITSASAGSDTITLPDECWSAFIRYCAGQFLESVATGDAQARRAQMLGEAMAQMSALKRRYSRAPVWDGEFPANVSVVGL